MGRAAESRTIQIAGNDRTVMLTVPIGKSEDVRTDTAFVDLIVGDPEVESERELERAVDEVRNSVPQRISERMAQLQPSQPQSQLQ